MMNEKLYEPLETDEFQGFKFSLEIEQRYNFNVYSIWIKIWLHTENQLPRLPGSALKVPGCWLFKGGSHFFFLTQVLYLYVFIRVQNETASLFRRRVLESVLDLHVGASFRDMLVCINQKKELKKEVELDFDNYA